MLKSKEDVYNDDKRPKSPWKYYRIVDYEEKQERPAKINTKVEEPSLFDDDDSLLDYAHSPKKQEINSIFWNIKKDKNA